MLLLVFWYCHKRGREVRLEKERLLTEAEAEALNEPSSSSQTTTAAEGAPIDQVEAGLAAHDEEPATLDYAPNGSLAKELAKDHEKKRNEATHTIPVNQGT